MTPFQLVIKPIGPACNLACEYCYYTAKAGLYPDARDFRMSEATLESTIAQYLAAMAAAGLREIWMSWQGGEPTLLGRAFFEDVLRLQAKHGPAGTTVRNAVQTNATRIDAGWAAFLAEARFLVGVSVDGPERLHDRYRHDRGGRGSFADVMRGVECLHAAAADVNALTTVNRFNARHGREVYRFLKSAGFTFIQFIPVVEALDGDGRLAPPPESGSAPVPVDLAPWSVPAEDYGAFLCRVFDDWVRHDVGRVFVQAFDALLACFAGEPAGLCWLDQTCGRGLALEHNGDLYSCDHYVHPAYRLGNILESSLAELADGPRQRAFGVAKAVELSAECRACEWLFACAGGCPKHRLRPAARSGERISYFCRSQKRVLRHTARTFTEMAAQLRRPA